LQHHLGLLMEASRVFAGWPGGWKD